MRTRKRIFSAILVAAMLVSTIITTAFADGEFTATASSATAKAGETVDVTVSLANNPGIIALRLGVGYNSDVLTLTGVKDGAILGAESHSDDLSKNPYILYWINGEAETNYVADGTVATLTFSVSDSAAAGDYDITVTVLDSIANVVEDAETGEQGQTEVPCVAVNGKVTVEANQTPDILLGDINLDNSVDIDDAILLYNYSMAPDVYPISYTGSVDFTKDGSVDIDDAIKLYNYSMAPDVYPIE